MLMDVHQRGDLAPTIAPRVVNRGLRYAPQSFTPVPGSTLHLGGVGKNRIGKVQSMSNIRMDTCADPQGYMWTLYQRLCRLLRRRRTRADVFSSWPMMIRASEPPMKWRRSM